MKTINKIALGLVAMTFLFAGCSENSAPIKSESLAPVEKETLKPTISEDSLGLRKTTVYDENVTPHGTSYSTEYAGSGHKIKRAFQDAPPMIPHDAEGMLDITINENQCIGCHDPLVAADMGATPYPPSHTTNFRPDDSYALKGENTSDEAQKHISIKEGSQLVGARFNCTQCHAPQDTGVLAVPNTFEPVFTAEDGADKSTWSGTKLMEGINTFENSK